MRVSLSLSLSLPGLLEGSVKNKMGLGEALSDAFSDCGEGKKERERKGVVLLLLCVCVCVQGGVGIRRGKGHGSARGVGEKRLMERRGWG